MGRGSSDQAATAKGLLYGARRRGSGPKVDDSIDIFFASLAAGHLPRIRGIKPSLTSVNSGNDPFGGYVQGQVGDVWDRQVEMNFFRRSQSSRLVFNFPAAATMAATGREITFLRGLSQALNKDNVTIDFSFPRSGQMMSMLSLYGHQVFRLNGRLGQSEEQVLSELAEFDFLDKDEAEALRRCSGLSDAWQDSTCRKALMKLNDQARIWLSTTPAELIEATSL